MSGFGQQVNGIWKHVLLPAAPEKVVLNAYKDVLERQAANFASRLLRRRSPVLRNQGLVSFRVQFAALRQFGFSL